MRPSLRKSNPLPPYIDQEDYKQDMWIQFGLGFISGVIVIVLFGYALYIILGK